MSNTAKALNLTEMEQVTGGAAYTQSEQGYAPRRPIIAKAENDLPGFIEDDPIVWQVIDNNTGVLIKSVDSNF